MKKLLAFLMIFVLCLSLAACGKGENTDTPSSEESPSSVESESGEEYAGLKIDYTAVFDGYIDHNEMWQFDVRSHDSFQCMTDELLFVPAGTAVTCEKKLAVYCYYLDSILVADELRYDIDTCKALGQTVSETYDVMHAENVSYVFEKDCLVRFSVKGKLSDVQVIPPKGQEDLVYLTTDEEYIEQNKKLFH